MKKLYLLFLMLLIMFIPVTHSIAVYQLDQPIRELNNHTLREVFENRNMAMPNWIGKPLIETNVYRLYDANGVTIDYNINNGDYIFNGSPSLSITTNFSDNLPLGIYTIKSYSSTSSNDLFRILGSLQGAVQNRPRLVETSSTDGITIIKSIGFWIYPGYNMNNIILKVQIEKGSQATPYQVPTNGPYSNIDISQFNLTAEQIQTYYNLYLEAVRFELENIEARQDEGGYQNIFKSILDGVKNLMQEMGNVWNFLNAPIITNDMQNYQPPAIDWSWDIIGVVRQIVNNANTLAFQLFFIVPSLIYSLLGIPIHISLLSLLFSNLIFLLLGWIVVKSFII